VSHANARLTPAGRSIMVGRIATGRPPAHVAAEMGVSGACAYKWWRRWRDEGEPGLIDRPSHARSHSRRTPACTQTRIRIARHLSRPVVGRSRSQRS
jgi:transposase